MTDHTVITALTPEEWGLVARLRDVPDGRLHRDLVALLWDLLGFASEPGCRDAQADGVPCASARSSCDECQRIRASLALLRQLVADSAA